MNKLHSNIKNNKYQPINYQNGTNMVPFLPFVPKYNVYELLL